MNCYLTCPCIPILVSHGHILKPITGSPAAPHPLLVPGRVVPLRGTNLLIFCLFAFICSAAKLIQDFFLHYYFLKKHEVNSKRHVPLLEPCFDRNAADPSHFKKMLV